VTTDREVRGRRFLLALALSLPVALLASLVLGVTPFSLREVLHGLLALGSGDATDPASLIVGHIRLPRALTAACCGAVLALCGAASQGLFRNPLADPSLIGVTGGASLGAALAMVAAAQTGMALLLGIVSVGAFLGGTLAVLLVYWLATDSTGTSVATMLLAGIGITALSGAAVSLLEFRVDDALLRRISLWKMGGFGHVGGADLTLALATMALLCLTLPRYRRGLNALLLGESEAGHLGIDTRRLKRPGHRHLRGTRGHHRLRGSRRTAYRAPGNRARSPLSATGLSPRRRPAPPGG
jgi:iron complex transport system permease protein